MSIHRQDLARYIRTTIGVCGLILYLFVLSIYGDRLIAYVFDKFTAVCYVTLLSSDAAAPFVSYKLVDGFSRHVNGMRRC